ncbi:MAG: glycosyltransferase family 2 protein [Halobacteriovoraceae bacterium]|nr:glycosyltransferase family 2 protein [Halobacteriovoraceae bacterium]
MKLSICIPTYNREPYLEATVRSIYENANGFDVEVSIVDNHSTDKTKGLLEKLSKEFPTLTYKVNSKNIGPDLNYMACLENSTGDYCWFMGSDDHANDKSIENIFRVVRNTKPDILLFDRVNYGPHMKEERGIHKFLSSDKQVSINTLDPLGLKFYLSQMNDLGGVFSYLSSIVVKRSLWDKTKVIENHIGTAYLHTSRIFLMMKLGASLTYEPFPIVKNRMGNDFFAGNGYVKRVLLDLNYFDLVKDIFEGEVRMIFLSEINRIVANLRTLLAYKFWAIHYQGDEGFNDLKEGYDRHPIDWGTLNLKRTIFQKIPMRILSFLYFKVYVAFIKKKSGAL